MPKELDRNFIFAPGIAVTKHAIDCHQLNAIESRSNFCKVFDLPTRERDIAFPRFLP